MTQQYPEVYKVEIKNLGCYEANLRLSICAEP